jgi:hypothetical protein
MKSSLRTITRRTFLASGVTTAAAVLPAGRVLNAAERKQGNKICAFIKFLQSLSYEQLAETTGRVCFCGDRSGSEHRSPLASSGVTGMIHLPFE